MSWFKLLKKQSEEIPDGIKEFNEYNRILAKLTAEQRAEIREKAFLYWAAFEWDCSEKVRWVDSYLRGYLNALVGGETITYEEKNVVITFIKIHRTIEVDWNWCDDEKEG